MRYLIVAFMTLCFLNTNLSFFLFPAVIILEYIVIRKGMIKTGVFNSVPLFFLALFGVFYVGAYGFSLNSFRIYFITPILVYVSSWFFVEISDKNNKEEEVLKLICCMLAGFAVHALLNALTNETSTRGEVEDIFYGEFLSATCAGAINTGICSMITCLIITKRKAVKIVGSVFLVIALWYASILGSRTQIVITVIVFVITFYLYLHESDASDQRIKNFRWLLLIAAVIAVIYYCDFLSIRTTVENSNLYGRFTESQQESDSLRVERFIEGLTVIFREPFGDPDAKYFHNFWLDIGRTSGIIPFLFILFYSIVVVVHGLRIFKRKQLPRIFRFTVLSIYLGLLMNLFVEPAMEGMYDIVLSFIFINGAVDCFYYSEYKNVVNSIENKINSEEQK